MLFKKGDKVPYKARPYQQTKEFLERLRKQGFKKGSKVNLGRKMKPSQGFQKGEKHWGWKGDEIGAHPLHTWIKDNFEKIHKCEVCGTERLDTIYDWSNKDHKYTRNREDWWVLCRGCHMKYDIEKGFRVYK